MYVCVCDRERGREYVKMTFKLFHKDMEMKQSFYKEAGDLV